MLRPLALALLLTTALPAAAQQLSPPPAEPAPPPYAAPPVEAEAPPEGRVFCDQNVAYHLAERGRVPEPYRRFVGIWSDAAWDARTCAALIVENVGADGTATIIYVYGPLGSEARVPGGILHGTGVIRDGALRFQNSDGSQFAFRPGVVDLLGRLTTPRGDTYEATFKQTF